MLFFHIRILGLLKGKVNKHHVGVSFGVLKMAMFEGFSDAWGLFCFVDFFLAQNTLNGIWFLLIQPFNKIASKKHLSFIFKFKLAHALCQFYQLQRVFSKNQQLQYGPLRLIVMGYL